MTDNVNPVLTVTQSGTGDLLLVKDGGTNILRVQDGGATTLSAASSVTVTDNSNPALTVTQSGTGNLLLVKDTATNALQIIDGGKTVINSTSAGVIFEVQASGTAAFQVDNAGSAYINAGTYNTSTIDLAEVFETSGPALEPGDVVVIDTSNPETMTKSTRPNDSLVAGIVSTKPGVLLGAGSEGSEIALAGRVPTKASDENGPIEIGDLLVTSSTPGHVMKAPENPEIGTIVGKALSALPSGTGTIIVLVTLQ